LPKALVDQGGAVATGFGVATLIFTASIPGRGFTGYLRRLLADAGRSFMPSPARCPGCC
jgi:hypothetical protein